MAYEQRPGQASLFRNDKGGVDTRPDYTGTGMTPDGKEVKLSAWVKKGKDGTQYMSISIQSKEQHMTPTTAPVAAKQPEPVKVKAEVVTDDLPF